MYAVNKDDVEIIFLRGTKLRIAIGRRGVCAQRTAHPERDGAFVASRLGDHNSVIAAAGKGDAVAHGNS